MYRRASSAAKRNFMMLRSHDIEDQQLPRETIVNELASSRPAWLYALLDPVTHAPRYIGRTMHPRDRLRNHIADATTPKKKPKMVDPWIVSLLMQGTEPLLVGLLLIPQEIAPSVERAAILIGRDLGYELLNSVKAPPRYFPVNKTWTTRIMTVMRVVGSPHSLDTLLQQDQPNLTAGPAIDEPLTRLEVNVLRQLTHGPAQRIHDLVNVTFGEDGHKARRTVERLARRGFVTFDTLQFTPGGCRSKANIHLTPSGVQALDEAHTAVRNAIQSLLAGFSDDERMAILCDLHAGPPIPP